MNIRKISIKIFASLLLVPGLVGCKDLMDTNPATGLGDEQVLRSVTNLNMMLEGTYRDMHFGREGLTFYRGVAGSAMYIDVSGNDIVMVNVSSGPHLSVYNFAPPRYSGDEASGMGFQIWNDMYNLINACNIIIDNVTTATGDEVLATNILGQALAIRGYSYFQLIRNFQRTYTVAGREAPGVILRTSSLDNVHMGISTVGAVYDQIIKDLKAAKVELKDFQRRTKKDQVDQYVAAGILARVYLIMNDWEACEAEADFVLQKYNTLMTKEQFRSGLTDVSSIQEVMWATYQSNDLSFGYDNPRSFWRNYADFEKPAWSYGALMANEGFVKLFDPAEDRYQFWNRADGFPKMWAYDKWFEAEVDGKILGDLPLMRGAEMLLMRAEARANQGNTAGALEDLKTLQAARAVPAAKMTNTADKNQLLEEIYIERRKELLGEGVTGMFDLLRLNRPLERDGHHTGQGLFDVPANAYNFLCQIPSREISINDALSSADQFPLPKPVN